MASVAACAAAAAAAVPRPTARKVAVITGGNSGLGKVSGLELARAGYEVVLACRSAERGAAAAAEVSAAVPDASVRTMPLDLASLASVRAFAESFGREYSSLDVLMNNAGVMALPVRETTSDGFEMQLGVNHLGHFLLTSLLLEPLAASASAARVVNLSSVAHSFSSGLDMGDLQLERPMAYSALGWKAYGNSKLANLLFTYELDRRLRGAGLCGAVAVNAVHPGVVDTDLPQNLPFGLNFYPVLRALGGLITPEEGARGQVALAAGPEYEGVSGKYVAEQSSSGRSGVHAVQDSSQASYDVLAWERFFDLSTELTGADWAPLRPQARPAVGAPAAALGTRE